MFSYNKKHVNYALYYTQEERLKTPKPCYIQSKYVCLYSKKPLPFYMNKWKIHSVRIISKVLVNAILLTDHRKKLKLLIA